MRAACTAGPWCAPCEKRVGTGNKEHFLLVAVTAVLQNAPVMAIFLLTDVYFIATLSFLWKVSVITLVSCLPLYVLKYLRRRFSPPSYSKLTS